MSTTAASTATAAAVGTAQKQEHLLAPVDYVVVFLMIGISSVIGIYHGVYKGGNDEQKKRTMEPTDIAADVASNPAANKTDEKLENYFLAGRKMRLLPVTVSFFATAVSATTMLGTPAEVYNYGFVIVWWSVVIVLAGIVISYIFIPVFYNMRSANIYKFLEVRYNRTIKDIITTVVIIKVIFTSSAILYGTSTAFSKATDINTWYITAAISGVCVVYTSVGGMKGVMWADVIQGFALLISQAAIIIVGLVHIGGFSTFWQRNGESGRLDVFDFDTSPSTKHTVWTSTVGEFVLTLSIYATSQAGLQRFMTAPSIKHAQRATIMGMSMLSLAVFMGSIIGLICYASFHDCDPISAKAVNNGNQVVPFFVMTFFRRYPMLPGLFFGGLLSASLSTLSSVYNSLSALIVETHIMPLKQNMSEKTAMIVCKNMGFLVAALSIAGILVTQNFPNVRQAFISVTSATDGSLLVLIFIGIFLPQANTKVAIVSFLSGIAFSLWIVAGSLLTKSSSAAKQLSTDGCLVSSSSNLTVTFLSNFNVTSSISSIYGDVATSKWIAYFPLHEVSYMWIAAIGVVTTTAIFICLSVVLIGAAVDTDRSKVDFIDVIPTVVQDFHQSLSKPWRKILLCDVYDDDDQMQVGGQKPCIVLMANKKSTDD